MLKAPDKKTAAAAQHSSCYDESVLPSLGIAFWRKDGSQRFAPYSFLSAVDFDGKGQLIFRFTSWSANVRGDALQPLWMTVQEGRLAQVRELDQSPGKAEPWVRELIFVEADAEQALAGPPFPEDRVPPHGHALT